MATRARVAVLDDDADVANAIAALFAQSGCEALAFGNSRDLLQAARRRGFDAYIVDWQLDHETALALVVELRGAEFARSAPIFMLSGNLAIGGRPTDPDLAAAIRAHRLVYRRKPYSPRRLVQEVLAEMEHRPA